MVSRRQFVGRCAALGLVPAAAFSGAAWAQTFPSKEIRLLVPFAPGGATDIVARIVAEPMSKALGRSLIVENRAGAGGIVGATALARSAPDGYTLGMATVSTVASNPAINPAVPYNPLTDFTPIINIAATPNVIAVHPSFPARDFPSFLAELRRNPGKYSYASSGTGGINHLQMELFKSLTNVFAVHIPYRGSGPALIDTVGGQVPITFDNLPPILPHLMAGRLIPIVVAAPQRLAMLPNVPTFKEMGLEPVNRMAFYGIVGPRGLSREVVDRVHAAAMQALADPAVRKRLDDAGALIVANTPEQFAAQIRAEFEVYKGVVARQNLRLD